MLSKHINHSSYLKLVLLHKAFATLSTLVGLHSSVNSLMDLFLLVRREALLAERACILKWNEEKDGKEVLLKELTFTSSVIYLLFTIVGSLVHVANVSPRKSLAANSTQERLFRGVGVSLGEEDKIRMSASVAL